MEPNFLKIHDIEYLYRPDFAPSKELLSGYKNKAISWQAYELEYLKILNQRNIIEKIDWNIFNDSVLLCSEPTAKQCHRRLFAEYLAQNKSDMEIVHL